MLAVLCTAIAFACLANSARDARNQAATEEQLIETPDFQREFLLHHEQSPAFSGFFERLNSACGYGAVYHVTELDFAILIASIIIRQNTSSFTLNFRVCIRFGLMTFSSLSKFVLRLISFQI